MRSRWSRENVGGHTYDIDLVEIDPCRTKQAHRLHTESTGRGLHSDRTTSATQFRARFFKAHALDRGLRVQREMHQLHIDFEIALQLLNTPGTEVTPRSNVIGEDFQGDGVGHGMVSLIQSRIQGATWHGRPPSGKRMTKRRFLR